MTGGVWHEVSWAGVAAAWVPCVAGTQPGRSPLLLRAVPVTRASRAAHERHTCSICHVKHVSTAAY